MQTDVAGNVYERLGVFFVLILWWREENECFYREADDSFVISCLLVGFKSVG